ATGRLEYSVLDLQEMEGVPVSVGRSGEPSQVPGAGDSPDIDWRRRWAADALDGVHDQALIFGPPLLESFPLQPQRVRRLRERFRALRNDPSQHQAIEIGAQRRAAIGSHRRTD